MKAKIYTKTGDDGTTGLLGGKRVRKDDLRLEVYGELDELNSYVGLAAGPWEGNAKFQAEYAFLLEIQSLLFGLGGLFACEKKDRAKFQIPPVTREHIQELEGRMDQMDAQMPPLANFILPGGGDVARYLHLCRVVCRRVERRMVRFAREAPEEMPFLSGEFLNRLSDYFFVLARFANFREGIKEILWNSKK